MNKVIRMILIVIGSASLYFSYKLTSSGEFTFKDSEYSIEQTPILFFIQTGLLFLFGGYLIGYALFYKSK
jgi:hypothetical protein